MPKQSRMASKLTKHYPHFLHPSGRIWIAKAGNLFKKDGKLWRVVKTSLSPIPGSTPVIELEEVRDE